MDYISAIVLVLTAVFIVVIWFMSSSRKLSASEKDRVRDKGIMHYTSLKSANLIVSERRIIASTKHKTRTHHAYFFGVESIPANILICNKVLDKECAVIITHLSKSQIDALRIRREDFAIAHKGDFVIETQNQIQIKNSNLIGNALFSNRFKIYRQVQRLCAIILMILFALLIIYPIVQYF